MRFEDFPYHRPDLADLTQKMKESIQAFRRAASIEEQREVLDSLQKLRASFESMSQLVKIRHTMNTADVFYKGEQEFFDRSLPEYQGLISGYYAALLESPYRTQLEQEFGAQLFRIAELSIRTFSQDVVEELQRENKLASEYVALTASAVVPFDGKELNLAQITPYTLSPDRNTRKRALDAKYTFFEAHEEKLDRIYDELVKVRTATARKLGYANFVELAYARLKRTDYDAGQVRTFREQVKRHLVPLASKLREAQRKRIGVDRLMYYDDKFAFPDGNPAPKGAPAWIIDNGRRMYEEMSKETSIFFSYMQEHGLMDLVSRKGKAVGGYCAYIAGHQAPFIFSNFNGTSGDIDVLTHEAGHAFQMYMSRSFAIPEYTFPTLEACEIHSMSMEFFAWPWMELFFQEDTEKYKFDHLAGAVLFIPYGTAVDEFQHFVYEHPEATPSQRKQRWLELEGIYMPELSNQGSAFLERGGFWYQQRHIFRSPFYYIDYALAQICALQFWCSASADRDKAWSQYIQLCKQGGSRSFLELVDLSGLMSPFGEGTMEQVTGPVEKWLRNSAFYQN